MNVIIEWLCVNWIEITGACLMLLFIYLEIIRKWTMWLVCIFSGLFYIYINFNAHLYALAGLCTYNVVVAMYGLYCWKFAKTKNNQDLPFRFITKKLTFQLLTIGMAVFAIVGGIILLFTEIPNPIVFQNTMFSFFLDNLITTTSIIATWMATQKIVESWCVWIFINPCSIVLYLYKGMYPSALLYGVFTIFSIVGYVQWRKIALNEK